MGRVLFSNLWYFRIVLFLSGRIMLFFTYLVIKYNLLYYSLQFKNNLFLTLDKVGVICYTLYGIIISTITIFIYGKITFW